MHSAENVYVNSKPDTTVTIRRGLELYDYEPSAKAGEKRNRVEPSKKTLIYGVIVDNDQVLYSLGTKRFIPRTHSRIALSTYGWPLKYFLDLLELLQVLGDGIKGTASLATTQNQWSCLLKVFLRVGHKFIYILCWVLHGDVSSGNILISVPLSYDPERDPTTGCLIDLDHARKAPGTLTIYKPQSQEVPSPIKQMISVYSVDEKIGEMIYGRLLEDNPDDDELELYSKIVSYLPVPKKNRNGSRSNGNEIGGGLTMDAWNFKVTYLPIVNPPYHMCP